MAGEGVTVTQWRDAKAIVDALEPHEPAATPIVAPVLERGLGRNTRVWRVDRAQSPADPLAVLCTTHICLDRWVSSVVELEPGTAEAFLPLFRRLPARRLFGPAKTVMPLVPSLRDVKKASVEPSFDLPAPVPVLGPLDERARLARPDDLPALVDLAVDMSMEMVPTRPRLRRILTEAVRRQKVLVLAEGDDIVATQRIDHLSRRYGWMGALAVRPDRRGEGLSWQAANAGLHHLLELGLSAATTISAGNPMRATGERARYAEDLVGGRPDLAATVQPWLAEPDELREEAPNWCSVRFNGRPPPPGGRRAWRALELVEGPVRPRSR